MPEKAWLSIGSNVGERQANLAEAVRELSKHCKVKRVSKVYETEPVGFEGQPMFLNQAIEVETSVAPREFLALTKSIEQRLGRVKNFRWGPRKIDIDIIFFGSRIIKEEGFIVPHERAHERRFVLVPMAELEPGFAHPVLKRTVKELLKGLPKGKKDAVRVFGGEKVGFKNLSKSN